MRWRGIVLETRVGLKYKGMTELREFLARRGRSILAHGLVPIRKEDAQGLFKAARELLLEEIKDFDRACALLQFPWLEQDD